MGLWSDALKNKMIYENGSVLKILEIPEELKSIYKYFYFLFVILTTMLKSWSDAKAVLLHIRTVWEMKQKTLVDMAADRGCYIDQSQSLNIYMDQPDPGKLTSLHFYAWFKVSTFYNVCKSYVIYFFGSPESNNFSPTCKGLKTGMYYLRTRAAADAIKFTVDTSALNNVIYTSWL